jgi:hypothetical protein
MLSFLLIAAQILRLLIKSEPRSSSQPLLFGSASVPQKRKHSWEISAL